MAIHQSILDFRFAVFSTRGYANVAVATQERLLDLFRPQGGTTAVDGFPGMKQVASGLVPKK